LEKNAQSYAGAERRSGENEGSNGWKAEANVLKVKISLLARSQPPKDSAFLFHNVVECPREQRPTADL